MAQKIDLNNVGWRAFVDNVVKLSGFPKSNNGATTTKKTLDQMAANQNELIDRVAALEARPTAPFPEG
jgi:hypothetical protein